MKTIIADLSNEFESIEIHTFSDEHIGDAQSDLNRIRERVEYVKNTPNAFCVMNGDLIDYASRTSIGDIETRNLNIMEQLQTAIDLFGDVSNKTLAITSGNHEGRSYKREGIDFSRIFAQGIGCTGVYTPATAVIFIKLGANTNNTNTETFTVFMSHGSGTGSGRREGGKLNALADMASICDCDVYIHSHTHLPMTMKQSYHRVDTDACKIKKVDKLFVNTGSNLDYGGYGEMMGFKPSSLKTPVIHLASSPRNMFATL